MYAVTTFKIPFCVFSFDEDDFIEVSEKLRSLLFKKSCTVQRTNSEGKVKIAIPLTEVPENITKLSIKATPTNLEEVEGMKIPEAK